MEQTVYADVLFAVNFSMDFLALYVTDFLLKLKFNVKRCVLAAMIGAIYGVVSVTLQLGTFWSLLSTGVVGFAMCLLLNGFVGLKMLTKEMVVFLCANMIIGGGMTVVYGYFNAHGGADNILIYGNPETVEEQLPLAIFTVASLVITLIAVIFSRGISKNASVKRAVLEIEHKQKNIKVTALVDSGNLLTEPISGLPVIIIQKDVAQRLLDGIILETLTALTVPKLGNPSEKIRFILYESVSGKGMMGVFKPEKIMINGVASDCWVAISNKSDGRLNIIDEAIVPLSLVN